MEHLSDAGNEAASRIPAGMVHDVIAKHQITDDFGLVVDFEKSRGSYIHDALSKKDFLDCYSQFAASPVGYNHPRITEKKFAEYIGKMALNKAALSDVFPYGYAEWVETFSRVAAMPGLPHYFWVDGGTMAVENALKAAFDWKGSKNRAKGSKAKFEGKVMHFKEAFHGRSGYCLSLTNTDPVKTDLFPKFPDWPRIDNPKLAFPLGEENTEAVKVAEEAATSQIIAAADKYGEDIACLIIEPVQGEGGDNHFRKEFFQSLRKLADEYDFMLVFDEVQTGIGLTGKMWAYEHYGVEPDMVCMGKKIQTAGFMCGKRIEENENNVFTTSSRINSTWGGNLVDMVRATKYLEIIEEEKLVDNASKVGGYLLSMLIDLSKDHPMGNVRGKGLMIAFDLPTAQYRDGLYKTLFKNGLFCLKSAQKGIRLRPPLNFSKQEAELCAGIIEKSLKESGKTG